VWVIDSGASRHMTGNVLQLEGKTSVNPIAVSLPNGESAIANCQGSMNLGPKINLDKVLYIPNFSCKFDLCFSTNKRSKVHRDF